MKQGSCKRVEVGLMAHAEHGCCARIGKECDRVVGIGVGQERFRLEAFGGRMNYAGCDYDLDSGITTPLDTCTNYLGCAAEYEYVVQPRWWSAGNFLLGLGSRLWVRDIQFGVDADGYGIPGYQETWWTFYPYVGIETKQPVGRFELYTSGRIGVTPFGYNQASNNDLPVYPRTGLMAEVEIGLRNDRLSAAMHFEALTWSASGEVTEYYDPNLQQWVASSQPNSRMFTIGGQVSYTF